MRGTQHRVFLLTQASHCICDFFSQRGEIQRVIHWWNWSPIFALLNRTTNDDDDDDEEMTDAGDQMIDNNYKNNDFPFSFLEAIRWYADQASQAGFMWNPGVSSLDIPPAELIVEPLYPNLTVTRLTDQVIHTERWASSNADNSALWLVGGYFCLGVLLD